MKKTIIFIGLALLCQNFRGFAQSIPIPVEIQIGSSVPDESLSQGFGQGAYPSISALKGKVIIIDFWATWCSPCIAAFPKNEFLQEKFSGQIQFINAGYESMQVIHKSYSSLYKNKKTGLVWITDDKRFVKMFPHTYLPHYVWIDQNGIYRAATEGSSINDENIKNAISGDFTKLKQKTDKALGPGNKVTTKSQIMFSSTLSGYNDGGEMVTRSLPPDSLEGQRAEILNYSLSGLYYRAYQNEDLFRKKNTQFEVRDPGKFRSGLIGEDYLNWLKDGYGYNWRVQVPLGVDLYKYMQDQLKLMFPQYKASVEFRDKESWVLIRTSKNDKIASKGGTPANRFTPRSIELVNVPIRALTNPLKVKFMSKSDLFIVEQTGYSGTVDMNISADLSNMEELNKALAVYDLQFIKKVVPNKILIIRENNILKAGGTKGVINRTADQRRAKP